MTIAEILAPDRIVLDAPATSKKRLIETVGELLAGADTALTQRSVCESLFARERLGSTGLGHGVALPHGRMPRLERAIGAFVKVRDGVDFDAPDGQPVDLVFALVVPEECTDEHLEILARLAETFSGDALRGSLRERCTPQQACRLLSNAAPSG